MKNICMRVRRFLKPTHSAPTAFGWPGTGWARKVAEINAAGVRLARQAVERLKEKQGGNAWVAGAVGPLGVRLEPLGKTGLDEARAAFAEQIGALKKSGVDLLILETMPALNEARQALEAAKAVAPELPFLSWSRWTTRASASMAPRSAGGSFADRVGSRCRGSELLDWAGNGADGDRGDARGNESAAGAPCPTPACRERSRDGTSICALPSTWPALRAKPLLRELRSSAVAAAPRRTISAPCGRPFGRSTNKRTWRGKALHRLSARRRRRRRWRNVRVWAR